jgi:hypothetical protein
VNKYLEKIAGVPRFVDRAVKQGLKATVDEAKGVGARAVKTERAEKIYSNVRQKFYQTSDRAKRDGFLGSRITGTHQRTKTLEARSDKTYTRLARRAHAARLGQEGAQKALKVGAGAAAGTAAVGAAGVAAAKKD